MPAPVSTLRRALAVALAAVALLATAPVATAGPGTTSSVAAVPSNRPNIVFVLTDDLSWNLVRYMPHVRQMMRQGTTFTDYTVTDSLCCPSRASILTGEFPHDTGVHSNAYPDGGYYRFQDDGLAHHTFAVSLAAAGYADAFAGKYLNQYQLNDTAAVGSAPGRHAAPPGALHQYAPPGWSQWAGANGGGYAGYGYALALDHRIVHHGHRAADYLTSVLDGFGRSFVARTVARHTPFMLELASFAPHAPYVPAPADVGRFAHVRLPRIGAYDEPSVDPAQWLLAHPSLTDRQQHRMARDFRLRVESVQAVDRMIGALHDELARDGRLANTYVVFSSDNGLHMGEYRLSEGKQTPYDTDIRVPLIVTGPGVPAGAVNPAVVENTDLAPTFDRIAGAPVPANVDGASMLPLWHGRSVPWRTLALVEHQRAAASPDDPDSQNAQQGTPPSYDALRTATWTYVRYADGEHAFFDRIGDLYELDNVWPELPAAQKQQLDTELNALTSCHGGSACWAAGLPAPAAGSAAPAAVAGSPAPPAVDAVAEVPSGGPRGSGTHGALSR